MVFRTKKAVSSGNDPGPHRREVASRSHCPLRGVWRAYFSPAPTVASLILSRRLGLVRVAGPLVMLGRAGRQVRRSR